MSLSTNVEYNILKSGYDLRDYPGVFGPDHRSSLENIRESVNNEEFQITEASKTLEQLQTQGSDETSELETAFCITLFCMDDLHSTQAFELITMAFALFPKREYCLLSIPTSAQDVPLLQHFAHVEQLSGGINRYDYSQIISYNGMILICCLLVVTRFI